MRKKKFTTAKAPTRRLQKEPLSWKFCLATIFLGIMLAAGFFSAGWLQFTSMDYGFKNSALRMKIEELRSKNRRLKFSKEVALSPTEIKQSARQLGFTRTTVRNLEPVGDITDFRLASDEQTENVEIAPVRTYVAERTAPKAKNADKPRIVKTVKVDRVLPPSENKLAEKKADDPKSATRSRIIDVTAKR